MIKDYPRQTDILEVVGEMVPMKNTRDLFKENGIFFITKSKETLAPFCTSFFLTLKDYELLKSFALPDNKLTAVSAFHIRTENDVYETLESTRGIGNGKIGEIKNITRSDNEILIEFKYNHRTPGKKEFLNDNERECKILITKKDGNNGESIVKIFHEHPEDHGMVSKYFYTAFKDDHYYPKKPDEQNINLEVLTPNNRTQLFNNMLNYKIKGWELRDVIKIRHRSKSKEERETSTNKTSAISQAILHGEQLRDNKYVKELEKDGCYISGLTIQYAEKSSNNIYDISIDYVRLEYPVIKLNRAIHLNKDGTEEPFKCNTELREKYCSQIHDIFINLYFELAHSETNK